MHVKITTWINTWLIFAKERIKRILSAERIYKTKSYENKKLSVKRTLTTPEAYVYVYTYLYVYGGKKKSHVTDENHIRCYRFLFSVFFCFFAKIMPNMKLTNIWQATWKYNIFFRTNEKFFFSWIIEKQRII